MAQTIQVNTDSQHLADEAIKAAISLNWEEAVKLNQQILSHSKNNTEALNRLARAKVCLGKTQEAQKIYKQVLEIDPYNIIARKNIEKLAKSTPGTNGNGNSHTSPVNGQNINISRVFIFEPGKTKLVNLLNLAQPSVISSLNCGDEVLLNPKSHSVSITTTDKVYLGALPDDLAHRLITFIAGGNKYDAYVKSATPKTLSVFIREIVRSPRFATQPSFQSKIFEEDK